MTDIDPWGDVEVADYAATMAQFGIEPIESVADRLPDNRLVRRGIVFGQRDLETVLDARDRGDPFAVMTGLMPSGVFHFGHLAVLEQVRMFQEMGAEVTLCAADIEAYATRDIPIEDARELVVEEYLLNYVALGLDLDATDFYFQSEAGNDHLVRSKLFSRYVTQNEFEATYGTADPGKLASSLTQYADILRPQAPENGGPKPTVVPVGIDQDPHVRLTRDVASRYRETAYLKPASTYHRFMRGLQGGKMSSSDPRSHIALTDGVSEAKRKIDAAKTGGRASVAEHREKGGVVEEDMVFELLAFHLVRDDDELERIRREYESGAMLSGELKQIAKDRLETFLREHHEKREAARPEVEQYLAERESANAGFEVGT
ncbi:tryptophan--tRNA ligase [Haladaptatus sp. T7]|uniref:tryptophan--tRNA ligase n=1 Tax=Haladaptatus sp. T7 TaxID=2029368 RepID=UPI0021A25908|nr:tryptophan--tRNA ligase [Haladaptatus sp. T7]GKZ16212.1 tryptophan--tRNA ligase [Haladaptatus sp. T7]